MTRAALIEEPRDSLKTVQAYLYNGFTAREMPNGSIRIEGEDWHGFTLDAIIARLASGMIYATEEV